MTLIARMQAATGQWPDCGALASALRPSLLAALVAIAPVIPGAAFAQRAGEGADHPVLLELYTAQGCASCPPADEMMLDLASRDDVIALSLHVDYWDYIGWADTFADRAYTERQQRYARRYGHSTIYTPQVIINGMQIVEGFRVMEVMDTISTQRGRAAEVMLSLSRSAEGLQIRAVPTRDAAPQIALASRRSAVSGTATNSVVGTLSMAPRPEPGVEAEDPTAEAGSESEAEAVASAEAPTLGDTSAPLAEAGAGAVASALPRPVGSGPFTLQLIRYRPTDSVDILDGENAGLSARYANIVTSWEPIGSWDMLAPLEVTLPLEGDEPVVVIVQEAGQGEIVAAARLR